MLRLLGCLLEKPPWERPHGLSSLGVPACRKHCASPLHGYDSFITRGACLQASHVLPLSMGSFSIKREVQLQVHPYTLHLEEYHASRYRSAQTADMWKNTC